MHRLAILYAPCVVSTRSNTPIELAFMNNAVGHIANASLVLSRIVSITGIGLVLRVTVDDGQAR